ncbi:MAG: 4-alpha-glucanotransferase [bacterium]|nr:4-alpha-glucanotransferase [bacterium]
MSNRKSGILLHISSLPSPYGIGDFGPQAYKFADFLGKTKQGFWQVLPFNPTEVEFGNCPYNSLSVFAGNTLFISPDLLARDGFLDKKDLKPKPVFPKEKCDYAGVTSYKQKIFYKAYENFKGKKEGLKEYKEFCLKNSEWLEDFSIFVVLKKVFEGKAWCDWPEGLKNREQSSLEDIRKKYGSEIEREKFLQYVFHKQWYMLKKYCDKNGIKIIGDIPIYVCYDSVDVWKNPELFNLDGNKKPVTVSGVPPDYFSSTGQLWGNPVYRWDALKETNYKWWIDRMARDLEIFDIMRIDHFRGFVGYWEVPASEITAVNGRWVQANAVDFFNTVACKFPGMPFIAEDLGIITDDVREVIKKFNFPGMRVMLFAFGDDNNDNPYLPRNFIENCVVYTGTHDNNTVRGWFENESSAKEKERLFRYLGHEVDSRNAHMGFIKLAMDSVANTVVFPMQDILGLGSYARMNIPSTTCGNWEWRLLPGQITKNVSDKLLKITETYKRG